MQGNLPCIYRFTRGERMGEKCGNQCPTGSFVCSLHRRYPGGPRIVYYTPNPNPPTTIVVTPKPTLLSAPKELFPSFILQDFFFLIKEGDICSVCTEEFKKQETVSLLKCNHAFHHECLKKWMTSKRFEQVTCPNCRSEFY